MDREGYLSLISDTFASKPGKKLGDDTATDGQELKPKKGTELKVLDGKSAQNLCEYDPFIFSKIAKSNAQI